MFIKAISGLDDWSNPKNLAFILDISKGCFPGDEDNVIGTMFSSFIADKMDKLVTPKDMLTLKWETVRPKIEACVYTNNEYQPHVASILATRLLNYSMTYLSKKGSKTAVVEDRLLDIVNDKEDNKVFTEDLIFNVIKTLATKCPGRMNKVLMIPSLRNKILK